MVCAHIVGGQQDNHREDLMRYPIRQSPPSQETTFIPGPAWTAPTPDVPRAPSMQSTWYISPERLEQLRVAFGTRHQD